MIDSNLAAYGLTYIYIEYRFAISDLFCTGSLIVLVVPRFLTTFHQNGLRGGLPVVGGVRCENIAVVRLVTTIGIIL